MKKNSTKKALLLSVLSLLLCVSMLVGTTYAWFTDTVTSANNKIVAGTLEVDLLMADAAGDYASIADETAAIFGAGSLAQNNAAETLWEPGKTQIVYLGVENKGNLDLKYNILLNVIDGGLIGSLEYAVIDGANAKTAPVTADNWAAIKAAAQTGDVVSGTTVAAPNGAIEAGENAIDYFALAVHMKEDAGNEYQGKDITIDVTVAATQLASEEDSFGPDYDEMATFLNQDAEGNWEIGNAAELTYFAASVNGGKTYKGETVKLTADVDLKGYSWIAPDKFAGTFEGDGKTISNLTVKGESNVGFFKGISSTAKIQNVTFDKANMSGNHYVGVVVGWEGNEGANALIKNVKVTNSTVTCTVADNDNGDKVGGIVGYAVSLNIEDCAVENSTITGYRDVGGILGYAHKNVVVKNNTVKDSTMICDASVNYKNYTKADEYDVESIVGEAAATAVIVDNTADNCKVGREVYGLTLIPDGNNSQIIVNDKEGFLNLTKLFADWKDLFTDGNGTTVTNFVNGAGADYYYAGRWTVSLEADIDLNNATIAPVIFDHPVSTGALTFDGNDHTIKNAKIVTDATTQNAAGLFNFVYNTAVRNLKLDNIHVTGSNVGNSTAGVLAGGCNAGIDNITITNSSVTGGKYTGGVVGYGYTDVLNCTLTNVTVKGGYKLGGLIGYICTSGTNTGDVTGNTLTDCTVDGIGGGVYAGGKTEYVIGKLVGNYNCDGTCNNNTITNMTTSATENIGKIEAGKTVTE